MMKVTYQTHNLKLLQQAKGLQYDSYFLIKCCHKSVLPLSRDDQVSKPNVANALPRVIAFFFFA